MTAVQMNMTIVPWRAEGEGGAFGNTGDAELEEEGNARATEKLLAIKDGSVDLVVLLGFD